MAFSVAVESPMDKPERISRSLGIYAGRVTISSYATTLVECTAITKYFRDISSTNSTAAKFPHGVVSMACDAVSESGFAWRWDATTGAFRCFYPTNDASWTISLPVDSGAAGAALTFDSGGGAGKLHATSAVGNIDLAVAAVEAAASEANANDAVGWVNFVAVGFV